MANGYSAKGNVLLSEHDTIANALEIDNLNHLQLASHSTRAFEITLETFTVRAADFNRS